jgi:hypothetical protein
MFFRPDQCCGSMIRAKFGKSKAESQRGGRKCSYPHLKQATVKRKAATRNCSLAKKVIFGGSYNSTDITATIFMVFQV